ncbi:MAG: hypothetical protein IVW52_12170 [Acidimicrobiales bacterium]|nr:hypothetical protein [Acidimicrobiales bacterium]
MIDHVSPDPARLEAVGHSADGGPVVMLNLSRYRAVAMVLATRGDPEPRLGVSFSRSS